MVFWNTGCLAISFEYNTTGIRIWKKKPMPKLLRHVIMPPFPELTESQASDSFRVSLPSRQCTKLAPLFALPNLFRAGSSLPVWNEVFPCEWCLTDSPKSPTFLYIHTKLAVQVCSVRFPLGTHDLSPHWVRSTLQSGPSTASALQITISLMNLTAEMQLVWTPLIFMIWQEYPRNYVETTSLFTESWGWLLCHA